MRDGLGILRTKLGGAVAQLPYLPRALALAWTAGRGFTLAWSLLLVVQGLLPVVTVHLTRRLVDTLTGVVAEGVTSASLRVTLVPGLLLAATWLLIDLLQPLSRWLRTAQAELIRDHVTALIHEKSAALDLGFYESPDYYDHLHRARAEAAYRSVGLLESLGTLLQNTITSLAMVAVLVPFGLTLPLALLLSTLPALWVAVQANLRQHRWRHRTTGEERLAWYYDTLLTSGEPAAELRLFELGQHFRSAYTALRGRLREEQIQLARAQSRGEQRAAAAALLVATGALAWVGWRAVAREVTLGELVLVFQAFTSGQRLLRALLENVTHIYASTLFLDAVFEFLALRPRVVDRAHPVPAPRPLNDGIRFRGVTFRYPGSTTLALRGLDLDIAAGQRTAIVGPNGSGKSTIVKLLCRLHDPEAGRLELDGVDLRDIPLAELRRLIAVHFQEPVRYHGTLRENIAFGNLAADPSPTEVAAAGQAAGVDQVLARLPKGYETLLGKSFPGGTELSVGEWRRVALARAFVRGAPILLLDEPTAAMDPWTEAEWLERFDSLANTCTTLLITHRLTTAMRADVIQVVVEGAVVESGRHEELLALGGRYARAWSTADLGRPVPRRQRDPLLIQPRADDVDDVREPGQTPGVRERSHRHIGGES